MTKEAPPCKDVGKVGQSGGVGGKVGFTWCDVPLVGQSIVRGLERTLGEIEDQLRRIGGQRPTNSKNE